jgi:hypothetical protein
MPIREIRVSLFQVATAPRSTLRRSRLEVTASCLAEFKTLAAELEGVGSLYRLPVRIANREPNDRVSELHQVELMWKSRRVAA